ncbi:MAG TPA: prepilin peptidase [Serratia grimesii]|uniref:Prepilin peptidase n=1 Tax=Serratia grimesii TaxID=82995 RepID=A0A9C7QU93_9GAMM|nr:A24 family peptidase [Serratia grimesii]CAI1605288.1 Pectic enzymes secretion protein outO [Serratia grimesii]HCK00263.1 prepilin peptidase [Serratia grimesii]
MLDSPQFDLWYRGLFILAMLLSAAAAIRLIDSLSQGPISPPSPQTTRWIWLIALGAGLAALPFGIPLPQRVLLLPVAALLLALAFIDWQCRLLPDRLTQPLLWAGLLVNQQGYFASLTEAVTGATAGYLSLWLINAAYRRRHETDGIGQGDFKLLAALGAWTGWAALPVLVTVAAAAGLCTTAAACLLRKTDWHSPLPFGLYLAVSGWWVLLSTAEIG